MNERDELIRELIKEKGGTKEQYLSLLNKVAYHESAHTMDPSIKQKGGGPGRGKFQFEAGKNQGGITAARRTRRYLMNLGKEVPKWLEKASAGDSLDASKLNTIQQDILFLGNMRQHPKADLSKVITGEESVADFWANYHWAGSDKDRADRLESFNESMESYATNYEPAIKKKSELSIQPQQERTALAVQDNTKVAQPYKTTPTILSPQEQQAKYPVPTYDTESLSDVYSFIKKRKQPTNNSNLTEFEGGGTHEQNPIGGIPQGTGANGKPNTVEEGETAFEFGDDKFIFSDRISLTDYIKNPKKKVGDINQFSDGGNLNPTDPKIKTVKHGSKEYAKAYKEGRFANVPNQLDEVVINVDGKTGKNMLEEYPHYNELSTEDKKYWNDTSPIGDAVRRKARTKKGLAGDAADMLGNLVSGGEAALQAPQAAMVEGVEALRGNPYNFNNAIPGNKQRIPSDVWGYENPEGFTENAINMGMDVILDPTNISAAGVAGKILKVKDAAIKGTKKLYKHPIFRSADSFDREIRILNEKQGLRSNKLYDLNREVDKQRYKYHKYFNEKASKNKVYAPNDYNKRTHETLVKGVEKVDDNSFKVTENSILADATNIGEDKLIDFTTGKTIDAKVSVPVDYRQVTKNGTSVSTKQINGGDAKVNPEYIQALQNNINYLENKIPGFKVYGSAKGVTEGGLPHLTGDIDGYITRANYNKYIKDKYPFIKENGVTDLKIGQKPAQVHQVGNFGKQSEIDFNILEEAADGLADGSSNKVRELFRQVDPEGYYKAVQDQFKKGKVDPDLQHLEKTSAIKVPYTPDELLNKLDELDPTVKSIMDMYEVSGKSKHVNKIDSYITYGNPEKVREAQRRHIKSVAGPEATLGHQFPKEQLSNVDKNTKLLNEINYRGDIDKIAKDPTRMQLVLDDIYMNHTVLSRAVDAKGKTTVEALKNADNSYKKWKPGSGGEANGAGQNHVKLGDSNWLGELYGHKQLGVKLDTSSPENYLKTLKEQTMIKEFDVFEKVDVKRILDKHGFTRDIVGEVKNTKDLILNLGRDTNVNIPEVIKEFDSRSELLDEIGKVINVRATINGLPFGNSKYTSTLTHFNEELDKLIYGFSENIPKPNSRHNRMTNLKNKQLDKSNVFELIKHKGQFDKIYNLVDGGLEKAQRRFDAQKETYDKLWKDYDKFVDKATNKHLAKTGLDKQLRYLEHSTQELQDNIFRLNSTKRRMKALRQNLIGGTTAVASLGLTGVGGNWALQKMSGPSYTEYLNSLPEEKRVELDSINAELKTYHKFTKNVKDGELRKLREHPEMNKLIEEFRSYDRGEHYEKAKVNLKIAKLRTKLLKDK